MSALLASIHLPLGIIAGLILGVMNAGHRPRILLRLALLVIVFTYDQRFAEERTVIMDLNIPQLVGENIKKAVTKFPYFEEKDVNGHIDNAVEATNAVLASLKKVALIKDAITTVRGVSTGLPMFLDNLRAFHLFGESGLDVNNSDDGHTKHEGRLHCPAVLDNQTVNVDSPAIWVVDPIVMHMPPRNTALAILHPKKRAGNFKWTYYGSRSFMSSLFALSLIHI